MKTTSKHASRSITLALTLLAIGSILMGARAGCMIDDPNVVVVEPGPYYPPPTTVVVYTGDLSVEYSFGGHSCWKVGVESIGFVLVDDYGYVVAEDWGLPCQKYGEIFFADLPYGGYGLTVYAQDDWGYEVYRFDASFIHDTPYTVVDIH